MSNLALMAKILGSLPVKFHPLVTTWDNVPAATQTILLLQERLFAEEGRIGEMEEATSALAAVSVGGSKKKNGKGKGDTKALSKFTCYACGKPGYLALNCKTKKKIKKSESKQEKEQEKTVDAFVVTEGACQGRRSSSGEDQVNALREVMLNRNTCDAWLMDSGASRHICFRREWFSECRSCSNVKVTLGDDTSYEAKGVGTVLIKKFVNNQWENGQIENVLFVPQLKKNLFSAGICTSNGFEVRLTEKDVLIH